MVLFIYAFLSHAEAQVKYVSDDDSQSTNCSGERETTHDSNEDEKTLLINLLMEMSLLPICIFRLKTDGDSV